VQAQAVRYAHEIASVDGLVIPGGESTTIGKLMTRMGLVDLLRERIAGGLPVYGTCAGAILLARHIEASDQTRLGVMDISIARNAYGRQVDSFEADLLVPAFGEPLLRAVFIRAPVITSIGPSVETIGVFEDRPVLIRQANMLAGTFHPELTDDLRVHRLFVSML
jgi:5'-phosphate synthase pdxT subunit